MDGFVDSRDEDDALVVRLDAYEGPLDLLLEQARAQKVDLAHISILQLVDQYLAFVEKARGLRLELAADYLVMASWLALLKSRLLLPPEEDEHKDAARDAADSLALQLQRLDAVKRTVEALTRRRQRGVDWFGPGSASAATRGVRSTSEGATLRDLLIAYLNDARRPRPTETLDLKPFDLLSVDEAIRRLTSMLDSLSGWRPMEGLLPPPDGGRLKLRSRRAAHFVAALELVRDGRAEMRQDAPFETIYLRASAPEAVS